MDGWAAHPVAWCGDGGRFFSRVRHRGVLDRERGPERCHSSEAAADACRDTTA
jgi:hypothetical protein